MKKRILQSKFSRDGLSPLQIENLLMLILGIVLIFARNTYHSISVIGQVMILIIFLSALVGIARVPLKACKSIFRQVMFTGYSSGLFDSFIVLEQCKSLRTVEPGQNPEELSKYTQQKTEGVRAKFLAILMIAALVGGLVLWFGEVYAAGLFINDHRSGLLSALFILPPVTLFLILLGLYAKYKLPIKILPNTVKPKKQDIIEFFIGIGALLLTHNPMLCLGILLVYIVITDILQGNRVHNLIDILRNHTEINVLLVLFIALLAGSWLVENVITKAGLDQGEFLPIIPAALQSVLWGPLYHDTDINFWTRLTTLSTGALILPISSLVGVMLFKNLKQWKTYIKYSIPCAALWYGIMWLWIKLFFNSPIGNFLDKWAHSGGDAH